MFWEQLKFHCEKIKWPPLLSNWGFTPGVEPGGGGAGKGGLGRGVPLSPSNPDPV